MNSWCLHSFAFQITNIDTEGFAFCLERRQAKPSRHLWVGGIGSTVTRELIEGEFKRFGTMEDFKFLRDRNCAFVDYVKIEDAIAAVDSLNRKRLGDEELRVDFGRSQPPKRVLCIPLLPICLVFSKVGVLVMFIQSLSELLSTSMLNVCCLSFPLFVYLKHFM